MNGTTLKTLVPPSVAPPRGAAWAAELPHALAHAARWLWRELEIMGRLRARRHLLDLARHHEASDPELARLLRQASH